MKISRGKVGGVETLEGEEEKLIGAVVDDAPGGGDSRYGKSKGAIGEFLPVAPLYPFENAKNTRNRSEVEKMSKRWLINGVGAGCITGPGVYGNGYYTVDFSRDDATLEQIEGINWDKPTIEYVGPHTREPGLPEGYGFEVVKIGYLSNIKTYQVYLKVGSQYLGDVSGYQTQIADLKAAAAEQAAQLAETEENLAAANAQLAELEATYDDN